MGAIIARKTNGKTYYIYQESYRLKLDPLSRGKTKGSGKSAVRTKAIYLGTAEKILKAIQEIREPVEVRTREFGLCAAAYLTALEIGLPDLLAKHLPGDRSGVPIWIYFLVATFNRMDQATSKNKMSRWLRKTALPDLLGVEPRKLTGKNLWYAVDEILPQKLFRMHCSGSQSNGLFMPLAEDVFAPIETDVFNAVDRLIGLSPGLFIYDTTNFFTYIEEPKRSELANACHSKDSKHHLKHIGLLMAVEKSHGIPILSQIYEANRHDSRIFSCVLADLVIALKKMCAADSDVVIVMDKGNNSRQNFMEMQGRISWVGSLVPSHHKELLDIDLSQYEGSWKELRYYRTRKTIMGIDCAVAITFNSANERKKEHSLQRGIAKLKTEILEKWNSYKKPQNALTKGILAIHQKSDYRACLSVSVESGQIGFAENGEEIQARRKRFGKNLIFSNMLDADSGYLIGTYNQRTKIESDFQLLKDETLIRFRPIRHWTDTKIRAHAFCCVLALTLLRVMQWKAQRAGYRMTPKLLRDELSDIREVIMVYDKSDVRRKISERSAVQSKLWDVFDLAKMEHLLLHKSGQLN
jgi:transposase